MLRRLGGLADAGGSTRLRAGTGGNGGFSGRRRGEAAAGGEWNRTSTTFAKEIDHDHARTNRANAHLWQCGSSVGRRGRVIAADAYLGTTGRCGTATRCADCPSVSARPVSSSHRRGASSDRIPGLDSDRATTVGANRRRAPAYAGGFEQRASRAGAPFDGLAAENGGDSEASGCAQPALAQMAKRGDGQSSPNPGTGGFGGGGGGRGGFVGSGGFPGGGFAPGNNLADIDQRLQRVEHKLDMLIQMMQKGSRPFFGGAPTIPPPPAPPENRSVAPQLPTSAQSTVLETPPIDPLPPIGAP